MKKTRRKETRRKEMEEIEKYTPKIDKDEYKSIEHLAEIERDHGHAIHIIIDQEGVPEHLRLAVEHFLACAPTYYPVYYNIHWNYQCITSDIQVFPFNRKKYRFRSHKIVIYIPISTELFIILKYCHETTGYYIQEYLQFLSSQKNMGLTFISRRKLWSPSVTGDPSIEIPKMDFLQNCSNWLKLKKFKLIDEEIEVIKETEYGKQLIIQKTKSLFKKTPAKLFDTLIKTK